jgi:hypothetical protein
MKLKNRLHLGSSIFAIALFSAPFSGAQQNQTLNSQPSSAYDVARETALQGTVVSYTAASTVPPIGPHVTIQTASGVVDVHLGNAQLLKQNGVTLASGDSVDIVGENVSFGHGPAIFFARVLRKGSQTVTLRNVKGIPLVARVGSSGKPRSIFGGAQ